MNESVSQTGIASGKKVLWAGWRIPVGRRSAGMKYLSVYFTGTFEP
jgi:hypothetical protein